LFKLKHGFGFEESALNLLANYFHNRKARVKVNKCKSQLYDLVLGTGQGSVLGPLLFIMFVNDMPFFLEEFLAILFADDTSLEMCDTDIEVLLERFKHATCKIDTWCINNLIDINWDKTKIMIISQMKKFKPPKSIEICGKEVQVVSTFELLGIFIDEKLNFNKYTCDLRRTIYTRLYSIKQLFYLKFRVRLQFLKTFILPHFDYASTLSVYFSKEAIQRLCNTYNDCIVKIIGSNKIKSIIIKENHDYNIYNNYLNEFQLQTFQHRLLIRFSLYIYKIITFNTPGKLASIITKNMDREINYSLRNANLYTVPDKGRFNNNMECTFHYFFSKFLNENIKDYICLNLSVAAFKKVIRENINSLFIKFIETFEKFDLKMKNFHYLINNK
jgi:hypothetical protein